MESGLLLTLWDQGTLACIIPKLVNVRNFPLIKWKASYVIKTRIRKPTYWTLACWKHQNCNHKGNALCLQEWQDGEFLVITPDERRHIGFEKKKRNPYKIQPSSTLIPWIMHSFLNSSWNVVSFLMRMHGRKDTITFTSRAVERRGFKASDF